MDCFKNTYCHNSVLLWFCSSISFFPSLAGKIIFYTSSVVHLLGLVAHLQDNREPLNRYTVLLEYYSCTFHSFFFHWLVCMEQTLICLDKQKVLIYVEYTQKVISLLSIFHSAFSTVFTTFSLPSFFFMWFWVHMECQLTCKSHIFELK